MRSSTRCSPASSTSMPPRAAARSKRKTPTTRNSRDWLRDDLLEEATRLSGEKTYSRTVERALEELVRRLKARQILELRGSGLWEGDLPAMRRDRTGSARRRSRG